MQCALQEVVLLYSEVLPVLHEEDVSLVHHHQLQRGQEVKVTPLLPGGGKQQHP